MTSTRTFLAALAAISTLPLSAAGALAQDMTPAQIGPRPLYLVDMMDEGALKDALKQCEAGPFYKADFSIAHRGAPLQFPEHTREAYMAGARMGAGVMECDVTFTKDRELVCRHSQCDLHTTTNILAIPELAAKCTTPFSPADPATGKKAEAMCCTSDITLAEYRMLKGKMDASNPNATSIGDYLGGTPAWRTELYATTGTLLTHKESIALFRSLGRKFTPELKAPSVAMPFDGDYTQEAYAQQMIDEYKEAGIPASDVFPQSFQLDDILYWIKNDPEFGAQAVYLDDRHERSPDTIDPMKPETFKPSMEELYAQGVRIIAPPTYVLVTVEDGRIVPSNYAKAAKAAGLQIITWTLERSGTLTDGGGYYYASVKDVTNDSGDTYKLLDVLAKDVGVLGVFADWPATVTYYANCMDLK